MDHYDIQCLPNSNLKMWKWTVLTRRDSALYARLAHKSRDHRHPVVVHEFSDLSAALYEPMNDIIEIRLAVSLNTASIMKSSQFKGIIWGLNAIFQYHEVNHKLPRHTLVHYTFIVSHSWIHPVLLTVQGTCKL